MGSLNGVKVGDELLRTSSDRWHGRTVTPESVRVHKVGRTLVHILRYGRPVTYRIENGIGTDSRDGELWTPEDWELEKQRWGLEEALKRAGVELRPGGAKPVPVLKKLLAVLEGEL